VLPYTIIQFYYDNMTTLCQQVLKNNWQLIHEGNGTRVDVKESLHGLGSSLMKKTLKEGMRKNLEELKEKVE
jgi:hypothetical protein